MLHRCPLTLRHARTVHALFCVEPNWQLPEAEGRLLLSAGTRSELHRGQPVTSDQHAEILLSQLQKNTRNVIKYYFQSDFRFIYHYQCTHFFGLCSFYNLLKPFYNSRTCFHFLKYTQIYKSIFVSKTSCVCISFNCSDLSILTVFLI